jgi:hypothetical protein
MAGLCLDNGDYRRDEIECVDSYRFVQSPGRCRDQGQRTPLSSIQVLDEVGTRHQRWATMGGSLRSSGPSWRA